MSEAKRMTNGERFGLLCALAVAATLLVSCLAPAAQASQAWSIDSLSETSVAPGGEFEYLVQATNVGDADMAGQIEVTATLPPELTALSGRLILDTNTTEENFAPCTEGNGEPLGDPSDPTHVRCVDSEPVRARGSWQLLRLKVGVAADAGGQLETSFAVSGGAAAAGASTVDPIRVTAAPPVFGIDAFDAQMSGAAGELSTQAGAHPATSDTSFGFNTYTNPVPLGGPVWPVQPAKDVLVDLPPGQLGNPAAADRCTLSQLAGVNDATYATLCPPAAQVGTILLRSGDRPIVPESLGPLPIYNLVPSPSEPARFGFLVAGSPVVLDAEVRSGGDYGVSIDSRSISEALPLAGATVEFWGVPAAPSRFVDRACSEEDPPSKDGQSCEADIPDRAFLRNPTACSDAGLATTVHAESWTEPGVLHSLTSISHLAPGFPAPPSEQGPEQGLGGCAAVPFEPALTATPTVRSADSPTGLAVDLTIPQGCWDAKASAEEAEAAICQSDLKEAEVELPAGISVNPSSASGLEACSQADFGLHTGLPAHCPDAAKIGTVSIETPLLSRFDSEGKLVEDLEGHAVPEPLQGSVYLAKQGENPFGSLLALYLVAEGQGVVVKQAGEILTDPKTGQLTTRFTEVPQQPFSSLHLQLKGGSRAPLITPAACGTYTTHATLTGWSGAQAEQSSSFTLDQGCGGGFDPKLAAGTENPLAGTTSPFNLKLSREDGSQELGGLSVTMPPGLSGYLKGIPYCPDSVLAGVSGELGTGRAQEASPSCPAASQVGTVTVGAGAGPDPFYTASGRAYLAGPYKGAPLSLAVIAPAVAGPFDLGSVVVRNALHIDPTTAQITAVSDPLPSILHGIPLQLRDVRVSLNRPHFTLNPTSCEPFQIASTITSTQGTSAHPAERFQAAGCDRLAFKPTLSLALSGPTHRAAHPALRAVLRMPQKTPNANIAGATVLLPKTEQLENAHIRTICTRVQFNAGGGGGAGCPKGSVYGQAKAWSPLLDQPLQGPVYLRANGGERELPDLVASLGGQIHIDLLGYIDAVHARIRTRFVTAPDAPVEKFELRMQGAGKGLLANDTELCRAKPHATATFAAHNGALQELKPLVKAQCGGKGGKRRGGAAGRR